MNCYCTYFDAGFMAHGLALWGSIELHDSSAILYVLALDAQSLEALRALKISSLRVFSLEDLERGDSQLAAVKATRSKVEYYFTLSPCWPRWLLREFPELERITYLDADMFLFSAPGPIFNALDKSESSVLITSHRFPRWALHYARHGEYNVGIIVFNNDLVGRSVLDGWRDDCLSWCFDHVEANRYADQKYLEKWPQQYGKAVLVLEHPGVNCAPWNWPDCTFTLHRDQGPGPHLLVNGLELILFHFARFRPIWATFLWQSGQLDYGVMPGRLRNYIYGRYVCELLRAARQVRSVAPEWRFPTRKLRLGRGAIRDVVLRVVFGSDWWRFGGRFYGFRLGLGRFSGRTLAWARRRVFHMKRPNVPTS
jgi:hypothetical protein